jgi:hypothetical protein
MGDLYPYHLLNLLAIRDLERAKAPNIERLEEVGRIGRYTERNNIIGLAETFEVDQVMTFVAIKDK